MVKGNAFYCSVSAGGVKLIDLRNYTIRDRLADGTVVTVRSIRPGDAGGIRAAFEAMDREAIFTRFFTYKKDLTDAELKDITDVDFRNVVALVVTVPADGAETLIGGGRYFAGVASNGQPSAEVAFATAGAYRGRGIASLVLKHLVTIARQRGIAQLEAEVLAQNRAMLSVFRNSGLPMSQTMEGNVVHVTLALVNGATSSG